MGILPMALMMALLCIAMASPPSSLRILVPLKPGFREFASGKYDPASRDHNYTFAGFAVEVFSTCMSNLSYGYKFCPVGDGKKEPSYDDMVKMVENKTADGVVADITITEERIKIVDFTQPYIQSTLAMVVPFRYGSQKRLWDFLKPFSGRLWGAIGGLFFITGLVLHVAEHKNHFHQDPQLGEAPTWHTRISNVLWFTAMTLFFAQRSDISTKLGRIITVFWLFVVLILTSSYTASLSSILIAQNVYPTIQSFNDLKESNLTVGYQGGSFVGTYLQKIGFDKSQLKALENESDYEAALDKGSSNGGVAAILDESPYVEIFLRSRSCRYTTVGNEIAYFGGFAFVFQKNSTLTNQLSTALIEIQQSGELRDIKDKWLPITNTQCDNNSSNIQLRSFGGLFIIIGGVYGVVMLCRLLQWGYTRYASHRSRIDSSRAFSNLEAPL